MTSAYEPALRPSGRSRLASIKECGAGGTDCLAPTDIRMAGRHCGHFGRQRVSAQVPVQVAMPHEQAWNLADIDGDGRNDILWAGGDRRCVAHDPLPAERRRIARSGPQSTREFPADTASACRSMLTATVAPTSSMVFAGARPGQLRQVRHRVSPLPC